MEDWWRLALGGPRSDPSSGVVGSSDVIMFFNNSFLEFPLELNTEAELNLDINTQQDHSLGVNKTLEFNAER